jgi:hypothetical protein
VLKDEVDSWVEIKRTGEFVAQLCLENSILISNIFVSAQQFTEQSTALLRNIKREGIAI